MTGEPLHELPTPALVADRHRLTRNIADMAALTDRAGVRLRPHFKTSKCLQVARLQLDHGAIGFTCATPAEVTLLQDAGVPDLLWAHQPIGPAKVGFAVQANTKSTVTVALDSVEAATPLASAASAAGVRVPYLIEVDTGLGRAGVAPDRTPALAAALARLPGLELRGVFTHEGHLARHVADRDELRTAGRQAGTTLSEVARTLTDAGHRCETVSVGSTPGADSAPFAPGITEARPGTYVYYDANQVALGSATADRCALTVLTTVVSTPRPGTAITDAGLKAMSSDASVHGTGFGTITPDLAFHTANEEHGYLSGPGCTSLQVGDQLQVVPNHACGTVNMWSTIHVTEDGIVTDRWPIRARR
ncbi:alanine racemase [Actinomadura rubrisoli]|uniref:Alanine racemase n=1 Tax=Actinomadura rubrisoli TaxID=2530368 RepID=A0A4R5CDQ2_9ACTN|nr:alanine racemase [Actinomadura rubrisoli]TDD96430.1 alanine racemase [Actinomadura rubrisoli]